MIITEVTLENAPEQKDLNVQIKKSMEYLVPKREGGGGLTKAFIMKLQKTKDMKMILKASREGKKKSHAKGQPLRNLTTMEAVPWKL